jgi:hypothetical protein
MAKTRVKTDQLTITGATTPGQVLTVADSAGTINPATPAAPGIANVVEDTTPQLGGNLDVNGRLITSASNGDVGIQPDGSGAVDFGDKTVKQPYFKDVAEVVSAMGANDMNMTVANVFTKTISGATALTISNPPATGRCGIITLILTNGGAGVITWPTGTKWPGGSAPTLVASGVDVIIFMTIDAGTTWRAQLAQGDSK